MERIFLSRRLLLTGHQPPWRLPRKPSHFPAGRSEPCHAGSRGAVEGPGTLRESQCTTVFLARSGAESPTVVLDLLTANVVQDVVRLHVDHAGKDLLRVTEHDRPGKYLCRRVKRA